MKSENKRRPRSYKAYDNTYDAAMKRAKKEKTPLAKMMEEILEGYADGAMSIHFLKPQSKSK